MGNDPILITGAHRSGTTWLATLLAAGGELLHVFEPFNLDGWAYQLNGMAKYWFTYAPALHQELARAAFRRVLDRRTGRVFGRRQWQRYLPFTRRGRLLIKDPIACMSSEWLAENFSLQVLVLVRHPAAFAASLKRMQWYFSFADLYRQEQLMDDLLQPFRRELEAGYTDIVDQAALIWSIIYYVFSVFIERHPEWIVVKHETLSRQPIEELGALYGRLGLNWSAAVEEKIRKYTVKENPVNPRHGVAHQMVRDSQKNITRWKNALTSEEIERVRRRTAAVSDRFYTAAEW
jgi:hypothetical protein